jgi:hypothetical protein
VQTEATTFCPSRRYCRLCRFCRLWVLNERRTFAS